MPKGFPAGDPRARVAGSRGGSTSAVRRKRAVLSRVQRVWPGMPHEAMLAILAYGETRYKSGLTQKARRTA